MTDSVLHDAASCDEMCEVFEEICQIVPEREYLFVEHGNPYYHCAANTYLQQSFDRKGYHIIRLASTSGRNWGSSIRWGMWRRRMRRRLKGRKRFSAASCAAG
jgi:hypothetical protein